MKLFACFGGGEAAVADDGEAAAAVSYQSLQRPRRLPSFRDKLFSKKKKLPALGTAGVDVDDVYDAVRASKASWTASSASLDSAAASSSSSSLSSRPSTASSVSSSNFSGLLQPPPAVMPQTTTGSSSPAAGAAAVLLCLLMVVFCGRVGATVLTSTALYLFPRRWPVARWSKSNAACETTELPECDAGSASEAEEHTAKRKAVMKGFLARNRKN